MRLHIQYHWTDLLDKKGNPYRFPNERRTVEYKQLDRYGVYRWIKITRRNKRKKICLYIGESGKLYYRFYGYLHQNKSQATSFRIGRKLITFVKKGSSVGFQLLRLSPSRFDGKWITHTDLRSMHLRQAIEQSLIVYYKMRGQCKLNKEKSNRRNGS